MKGRAIIRGVCAHFRIEPADFFGKRRHPCLVHARHIAIQQMTAAGMRQAAIARLMKRDHSTIRYWQAHDEMAARRRTYFATYHAMRKTSRTPPVQQKRVSEDDRDQLLYLLACGKTKERLALQSALGLCRNYTTHLARRIKAARRLARSKGPIGPVLPIGPRTIRWTHAEVRA